MFTIPERLFEPTIIFFGLTNSPTMFQIMINEILWVLINTRVIKFIDNVIVETGGKKYKWKVKEVGFLEVVIELKGVINFI